MNCKFCDEIEMQDGEGDLCAACIEIGVEKLLCADCLEPTGDYGFPDNGDRCDNCIHGGGD